MHRTQVSGKQRDFDFMCRVSKQISSWSLRYSIALQTGSWSLGSYSNIKTDRSFLSILTTQPWQLPKQDVEICLDENEILNSSFEMNDIVKKQRIYIYFICVTTNQVIYLLSKFIVGNYELLKRTPSNYYFVWVRSWSYKLFIFVYTLSFGIFFYNTLIYIT